ncbi:hypothetical protein J6590_029271 [Homalodisca vitripennis]|nr:hypothetical protein J6590_029271 [Homalodisca vitripennis]
MTQLCKPVMLLLVVCWTRHGTRRQSQFHTANMTQLCKPVMVTTSSTLYTTRDTQTVEVSHRQYDAAVSTLTRQGTGRQSQYYTVNITQLCKPVMITSSSTLNTTKDTQTVAVSHCQYRSAV